MKPILYKPSNFGRKGQFYSDGPVPRAGDKVRLNDGGGTYHERVSEVIFTPESDLHVAVVVLEAV